ncbi:unnamed protein product [Rotaria socialis]|uniref:Uncharacterized protein n=1 Tax=Rotaria socialis TaxID=392032 RepID=A0A817URI4_9BILA|nr:unnamed protein product [Rotaria socialis]CAF3539161.1 unnamed protein product [Rotaria socialis]CAF3582036.1 unnamed protein product [Rotaria socialis]
MFIRNQINFPSTEDIQRRFIDFPINEIISYVDYLPEAQEGRCHIYTYPYFMPYYGGITNNFPELSVINRKSQNRKQSYESNTGNQNLSVIEYSFLGALDLLNVHDDYIEEFLINSKTCFPNNVTLYIHYKSLQRVTHNFTSDTTRINCGKIDELQLYAETKCSNSSLQEYFPSAKIKYRI